MTSSIMNLTNAVLDLIPTPAEGWKVYRQTSPKPGDEPPWIIETVTTTGHQSTETQRPTCSTGTLTLRIAGETTDSVNIIADDLMHPALAGRTPHADGFSTGALVPSTDSGAYAAPLTDKDTALLYQVRAITYRFNWNRTGA